MTRGILLCAILWLCITGLDASASYSSGLCTNPGTGLPATCDLCPEDQLYANVPVYCPSDTCTCTSGTGYNSHLAGHCAFGWGYLVLSAVNEEFGNVLYACAKPANSFGSVCNGAGTEIAYSNFPSLPYVVGFWRQGPVPISLSTVLINPPPHQTSSYLNGRCNCNAQVTTTVANCDTNSNSVLCPSHPAYPCIPCVSPTTGLTVACFLCPEDQTYAFTSIYCPQDTCTCAAGTGYNNNVAGQCTLGFGSLYPRVSEGSIGFYTCAIPTDQPGGICSGYGDEFPYEDFELQFLVGFWRQAPVSLNPYLRNPAPHVTSSYLAGRCACDAGVTTTTVNCDTIIPCPPQNGGAPCGGPGVGQCSSVDAPLIAPYVCECNAIGLYGNTPDQPNYCCPRLPVPPAFVATDTSPVCGGRGKCSSAGTCLCNSGFGGAYCCPMASGQTTGCGTTGTCQKNGQCQCNSNYGGNACQINQLCPSDNPQQECSGGGQCVQFNQIEHAITKGIYRQKPDFHGYAGRDFNAGYFTIPGTVSSPTPTLDHFIGDWTLVDYIGRLYVNALLTHIYGNTTVSFWNSLVNACHSAPDREQCFRNVNLAVITRGDLGKTLARSRYTGGHVMLWVTDALTSLYPYLSFFDSPTVTLITNDISSIDVQLQANGLALLMGYDTFIDFRNPALAITIPTLGSWYCVCNVDPGQAGFSSNALVYLPGGPSCAVTCPASSAITLPGYISPLGLAVTTQFTFKAACTGWAVGIFHGICQDDGTCLCSPFWGGTTCDSTVIGQCFSASTPNAFPCTSTHNGLCVSMQIDTVYPMFSFHCACTSAWTGPYCQFSTCAVAGNNQTRKEIECSNLGTCEPNHQCLCDVDGQLALSTSRFTLPLLPVGQDCSKNGIHQCGTFEHGSISNNIGTWSQCSGDGVCVYNTTQNNSTCVCDPGSFGNKCQFSACVGGCPDNAICNIVLGQCQCLFAFSGTNCTESLCQNGIPSPDGSSCLCDLHYTTDNHGFCSVIQCPLVMYSFGGPILCGPTDPVCAPNVDPAHTACCYDACEPGHCLLNLTSNAVTCQCDPPIAYSQVGGVCYPICNGYPYFIVGGTLECDCSSVVYSKALQQFVDAFCEVGQCFNGGVALTGGCSCASGFTDDYCATPICGSTGTLDETGQFCDCYPPYTNFNGTNPLCTANTCGVSTARVINRFNNGSFGYICSCPSHYQVSASGYSCLALATSSSSTGSITSSSSSSTGTKSSSSSTGALVSSSSSSTGMKSSSSSSTGTKSSSSSSTGKSSSSSSSSATHKSSSSTGASSSGLGFSQPGSPTYDTFIIYTTVFGVVGGVLVISGVAAVIATLTAASPPIITTAPASTLVLGPEGEVFPTVPAAATPSMSQPLLVVPSAPPPPLGAVQPVPFAPTMPLAQPLPTIAMPPTQMLAPATQMPLGPSIPMTMPTTTPLPPGPTNMGDIGLLATL